ncbi:NADH-quinone oxidoreductase subunit NuoF [Acaryochloris marina]|uniref:Proton-translocating NAD(P)H-quinone oxidoreductase, chain F, putative n=1 Tax=Acaryochloris marina (strain MBIC 11017) TaxID=329726 RepID=A8ZNT6_ACAM1|nr:NADH-quinone oxidoreductase subunit NuoF [Acaryochloris marina]ABW32672.1 proton-translocating NAD(P)H-quinone oxidoreductase, chain F, putative [Acaryochloris marina MBIC11017]
MDLQELQTLAEREQEILDAPCIRCCTVGGCLSANALAVKEQIEVEIATQDLNPPMHVRGVGCMGLCSRGPLVRLDPAGILYDQVTPEDAPELVHACHKTLQPHLPKALSNSSPLQPSSYQPRHHPFFTLQHPIVLENSGHIDPKEIKDYMAQKGYLALTQALYDMTPSDVIDQITQSGLRGRGGGGYPTGLKWSTVAKMPPGQKYVICNGDEGDPGAFMDRSVLESDPHRVLEGMAIAAYAVGANQGYIYIRGEYPLAINHLETALRQARKQGLLGSQIFESPFDFRIDIRIGAGAFVCGEETALMASIEGKRGLPHPRPPYPAESGLWGCPTLINNVETFANIAPIIRNGAEWFVGIGTDKSKGTKVFSLAGKIQNTGLIEVPMGTSLRQIVEQMGGGVLDGSAKAVQTGGPSGGCIPAHAFDTPVDYESLTRLGSIMGSGGMIVMDQATNMVDVARFFMEFCMEESCGKCVPCRAGTVQLYQLLTKICDGKARKEDLESLNQLCEMVKDTSLCGLGKSAPNPILSTLRFFKDEYLTLMHNEGSGDYHPP